VTLFHLAFPVADLEQTRDFYVNALGCRSGREAETWIDFDLFGHQISAHLTQGSVSDSVQNAVDGDRVPIPHFGCILDLETWHLLKEKLITYGAHFEIGPRVRFAGQPGEQATMFLRDPSGNALEFKAFADIKNVFETD
tara:strand:+ start:282 stop:698 length:417 start_codon:yes stop_codon:yes gene_type:complete